MLRLISHRSQFSGWCGIFCDRQFWIEHRDCSVENKASSSLVLLFSPMQRKSTSAVKTPAVKTPQRSVDFGIVPK